MEKLISIFVLLLPFVVKAQTEAEIIQQILDFKACFENTMSHELREKEIVVDDQVFDVMSERDFARENIIVSDRKELQKLGDKISYETMGVKGKFGSVIDWQSISKVLGGSEETEMASRSYTQDGTFHLLCHGITNDDDNSTNKVKIDDKEIGPKTTSEIIMKELEGYDIITNYTGRPFVVVVHSCNVGGGSDDSFAAKVSEYISQKSDNIYVVAAPNSVYPTIRPSYRETVKDSNGKALNWNCFHKGRFIGEGDKDFSNTVTKIQKKYSKKDKK